MGNHTFFIVCREKDFPAFERREGRDQWGWEFVDNIERMDRKTAEQELREYQSSMPHHVVRIRAVRIGGTRGRPSAESEQ